MIRRSLSKLCGQWRLLEMGRPTALAHEISHTESARAVGSVHLVTLGFNPVIFKRQCFFYPYKIGVYNLSNVSFYIGHEQSAILTLMFFVR